MVSSTLHEPVSGGWAITNIQDSPTGSSSTASTLLVQNEQFTISCWPTLQIPANDQINIDIKPSVGAAFTISRTAPAAIMGVNVLY
jgi:flagellin FlaB